ncbi:MAG: M24 family metallopeptidase [Porphyromonas sp.]|nr:M24 family metallopeptidase [Porphyromonas sp.]
MNITNKDLSYKSLRIKKALAEVGASGILLRSIPAHLYLTGSVFQGYTYIPVDNDEGALPIFFVERPTAVFNGYDSERVFSAYKPELIPDLLHKHFGYQIGSDTVVELGELTVTEYKRLSRLSPTGTLSDVDGTTLMRNVRSIKTEEELTEIRRLALRHMELYRVAPYLYEKGMTDIQWQHRLEYQMRRRGSIGIFRAFGSRMEIFMGNVSAGDNATMPAPYDFALGGAGAPAMPFGADGTVIRPGNTILVDLAGNYGVYTTDISRTYYVGELPEIVQKAHALSESLHRWFEENVRPGVAVSAVYNHCMEEVKNAALQEYFMGHDYQAKFVGHGLGIEINEPPVLTAKWKGDFQEGMVIALEPKFTFSSIGAVGIESTYIITRDGVENITPLPTEMVQLDY